MRSRLLSLLAALLVVPALILGQPTASSAILPAEVSGTVVVPPGYDVRDVLVNVVPVGSSWGSPAGSQWALADGSFDIGDLPPGSYRIVFLTYNRDLVGCLNNPAWWTGLGEPADGTCSNDEYSPDVATLVLAGGDDVDLGDIPVLSTIGESTISGTLVPPAGHSVAGTKVDVWIEGDGAYGNGTDGWHRPGNIPTQTVGADGAFSFSVINGYFSSTYALRVTDPSGTFAFSFTNGNLDETTPGAGGADFGVGSVGLVDLRNVARPVVRNGLKLKLPASYVSGAVHIEGVAEWGRTLTAVSDTVWSPAAGTDFQWFQGGLPIDGATGPTYVTNRLNDGFGSELTVRAVPAGDYASSSAPIDSAPVAVENTTPFNRTLPVTGGTFRVGAPLSATTGFWTPTAAPYDYTYEWLRGGVPIAGATASTYAPTAADAGKAVGVRVTATNPPSCNGCPPWFNGPGVASSAASVVRFTPVVAIKAKQKQDVVVINVKVTTSGPPAPGKVVVKDGKKKVGTLTLKKGRGTLRLVLKPGKHKLSASYAQTATVAAGSARTKLKVT